MTAWLARGMMDVALAMLGPHRRTWGRAMRAEFGVAAEAGEGLTFALGCLQTAMCELPTHRAGRLALSRYTFALGLILPVAGILLVGVWTGYPYVAEPYASAFAALARLPTGLPVINPGNLSAVPVLASVLLLRVAGLALVAWFAADGDWDKAGAWQRLGAAVTITLALFAAIITLDLTCIVVPLVALAIEVLAIALLRRWHHGTALA
jgi:hypothetical protein